MTPAKQFEHSGLTVKLYRDEDAQSPQDMSEDKGLFLVAKHRQLWVLEPGEKTIPQDFETLVERYQDTHWIFPLEAYIHSGVVLALAHTGNFPDRQWDVSQLGAVFCAKAEWRLSASASKAAQGYVETWNTYLSGDVYGFVIEDEDGNNLESCWGFYGHEYAEQEAKSAAEHASKNMLSTACLI